MINKNYTIDLDLNILEKTLLSFATISKLENSIIKIEIKTNSIIGLNECIEINNSIAKLTRNKEALILMKAENSVQFTSEARDFSASEIGMQYSFAEAMVVTTLAHKILASFYLKMNKPFKTTKVFNCDSDAIVWLLSLKPIHF